jgi:hypothetical protein
MNTTPSAHALALMRTAALAAAVNTATELAQSDNFKALGPQEIAAVLDTLHSEIARIAGGSR